MGMLEPILNKTQDYQDEQYLVSQSLSLKIIFIRLIIFLRFTPAFSIFSLADFEVKQPETENFSI